MNRAYSGVTEPVTRKAEQNLGEDYIENISIVRTLFENLAACQPIPIDSVNMLFVKLLGAEFEIQEFHVVMFLTLLAAEVVPVLHEVAVRDM